MNPFAGPIAQFLACAAPMLFAMCGALMIGVLAGWLLRPQQASVPPELAAELIDHEVKRKESEQKLGALRSAMEELKMKIVEERSRRDDLAARQQQEVQSLRQALVAAQRKPAPPLPNEAHTIEKVVPDPKHLARISHLERETARIPGLLKEIAELRDHIVKPAAKPQPAASTPATPLPDQVYRIMSTSFGRKIQKDDLQLVEGIGPKIKRQLEKSGVKTWADLAAAKPQDLKKVLAKAGDRFHLHDPSHWPEQARLMTENRWEELRKYQRKLNKVR